MIIKQDKEKIPDKHTLLMLLLDIIQKDFSEYRFIVYNIKILENKK